MNREFENRIYGKTGFLSLVRMSEFCCVNNMKRITTYTVIKINDE